MSTITELSSYSPDLAPQVLLLEAIRGRERRAVLESWLENARGEGATTFALDCDFDRNGLWTGLDDFLAAVMADLEINRPELIEEHSYELAIVFPSLRRKMKIRNESLTDSGPADERTRNFSVDRAYRIVQGLIDLTAEWHRLHGRGPLVFACDSFDNAGALVRRFFAHLIRRRGEQLGIVLLLACQPGQSGKWLEMAGHHDGAVDRFALDLAADPPESFDREAMRAKADEIEQVAKNGSVELQELLPSLIWHLERSGDPERLVLWKAIAFGVYNHFGFYEDAYRFSDLVRAHLDMLEAAESPTFWNMTRWNLVGNLFGCYIGVGEIEKARDVVENDALAKIEDPVDLPRVHWVMAMLHIRYLDQRDPEKAEHHLEEGLRILHESGHLMSPRNRYFLETFLENGLALVRHRQGRYEDAIELCRRGYERLEEHMTPGSHRLHRSVLLYNIAQVYAQIGQHDEAIRYYSRAMEMDPNYSEYYNERGNMFLKKGDLTRAIEDYEQAIALSSPYQEVWTNLGQACRQLGRHDRALEAYSRALDIEPNESLALIGRAACHEALGRGDEAIADYSRVLGNDPAQPLVLANRAVLHYEAGRLESSLADLDAAISLDPESADLLANRAVALADLGRLGEAVSDLDRCRALAADPAMIAELEQRLEALRAAPAGS